MGEATLERTAAQGDPARRVSDSDGRNGQAGKGQGVTVPGKGTANTTAQRRAVFCVFK